MLTLTVQCNMSNDSNLTCS